MQNQKNAYTIIQAFLCEMVYLLRIARPKKQQSCSTQAQAKTSVLRLFPSCYFDKLVK